MLSIICMILYVFLALNCEQLAYAVGPNSPTAGQKISILYMYV